MGALSRGCNLSTRAAPKSKFWTAVELRCVCHVCIRNSDKPNKLPYQDDKETVLLYTTWIALNATSVGILTVQGILMIDSAMSSHQSQNSL